MRIDHHDQRSDYDDHRYDHARTADHNHDESFLADREHTHEWNDRDKLWAFVVYDTALWRFLNEQLGDEDGEPGVDD